MSSHKKHTAPGKRVDTTIHTPSQSNHEPCFIPESVRQYKNEPLYILVAWWCHQQQDWLRRSQIAEAFHIPLRRASYLMAYLRNKTKRVTCESREVLMANNVYRCEIFVTRVMPPLSRKKEPSASPSRRTRLRIGNADPGMARNLWNRLHAVRTASATGDAMEDDDDA
ncbi:CaiF/GrlA family transcriptional regulator [Salmonella enterica]|nr:CaiF/GrlA family transcriptional regulator [Salmonella enterica]